ncbi:MAG: BREX-4 system phosphatase PglZ [Oscillospiraceae bacterium]|nr:BREX-4 system phosphatase PglZ [Oscillospiraceae bacterium]
MQFEPAKKYLTSNVKTPYFLFIGDSQYKSALNELSAFGLDFVKISDFCGGDDKLPDIDGLLAHIEAADINANGKKFAVTGLGEYLALKGNDEAARTLSRLKDFNVGGAKAVLLLRGIASQLAGLKSDPRFDNRRFDIIGLAECGLSFTLAAPSVGLSALSGFKSLLAELENGRSGNVVANTIIDLDKSLFTVHKITNAYEGIKFFAKSFVLAKSCGNDARWAELLTELNQNNGFLEDVFDKYGFSGDIESDFYARAAGGDYRNWLYFICLKINSADIPNGYLRFVLENTNRFEDFCPNILNSIIEIPHEDSRFVSFYRERKALIEKFPESDIADFVINNRKVVSEGIYKLTDGTKVEKEEIIAWISKNGIVPQIENIYPALSAYLNKYVFKCPELAGLLTEYFESYKKQKLSNSLESEFLQKVDELASGPRRFNRLPTRDEILDNYDKNGACLYWLDSFGVEYLAFIENLIQKHGLSISISIARAELPTITSVNRDFFDAWNGAKHKDERLDEIKHKEKGGYNFADDNLPNRNEFPVHLASELDIISSVIDKAATDLAGRRYERFLIASDHGASRLAVLRRKEEKYETDTKGEHSGRCCKVFQPCELPFAAEENGYLVLADYGRFTGSRAANVEVHGGASLEEAIVPVIELTLKNSGITVKLVDENAIADFRTGTEITLFLNTSANDVSVVWNGKSYPASQIDENHYAVKMPDMKRAGDYKGDVYSGDNLIGQILIKAQGKSGKVNDAFDDLF